jgi:hypothetical protein
MCNVQHLSGKEVVKKPLCLARVRPHACEICDALLLLLLLLLDVTLALGNVPLGLL